MAWWEYRERFLTEERINAGVAGLAENREALERIAATAACPPNTWWPSPASRPCIGRITGRYRVLDALATLGFEYPPRGAFFRRELEQFL